MFSFHNFGKNWNDNLITARRWNKTYILIDFHVKTISTYIPKVHACRGSRPFYNVDWVLAENSNYSQFCLLQYLFAS